jgi:hypothetical protein
MKFKKLQNVVGAMTAVRFLQDYRGVLTNEVFFEAGDIAEFKHGDAMPLVNDGRAELVNPPAGEPEPKGKSSKKQDEPEMDEGEAVEEDEPETEENADSAEGVTNGDPDEGVSNET